MVTKDEQLEELKEYCRRDRIEILKMLTRAGSGHPAGSLSCVEILEAIYSKMRYNPKNSYWEERDRFVLSKGHAAPALYVVLARRGYFDPENLNTLRKLGSILQGHPLPQSLEKRGTPGVEVPSGSLGQGLSQAIGIALALKQKGNNKSKVYVLCSDAEMEAGETWEATMAASKYRLENLVVMVDNNKYQLDGKIEEIMPIEPLREKWEAFGWKVYEVGDGNNISEIIENLEKTQGAKGPSCIICHTKKGKGVSFIEENPVKYHGVVPTQEELERALIELGGPPTNILVGGKVKKDEKIKSKIINEPLLGTREAFGEAIGKMAEENASIIVLTCDLAESTRVKEFGKKFPGRFFNLGIQEQNMMAVAGGLAGEGLTVFTTTFAIFFIRALEQIRQCIAIPNRNVKIVATHGGITVGPDGASHQTIEDIALMRSLPNMKVIIPADYYETKAVIRELPDIKGPVYVRLSRGKFPVIYDEKIDFKLGKLGVKRIFEFGEGEKKITIFACGLMVSIAKEAAKVLWEGKGKASRVINLSSIKPLPEEDLVRFAKESELIITVEEHSIIGGLGEAVSSFLSNLPSRPKIKKIGVEDQFGQSGESDELLEFYGLTKEKIIEAVLNN